MPMDPGQAEGAPGGGSPQSGGAAKLAADLHSGLLQFQELLSAKFPEDGAKMAQVVQAFQSVVDGLGQAPGQAPGQEQGPAGPATTTPEAGAASVQPAP